VSCASCGLGRDSSIHGAVGECDDCIRPGEHHDYEPEPLEALARNLASALDGAVRWLDSIAEGAPPLIIDRRAAERQVLLGMPNNVLGRDAMRGLLERARALGVTP
jgi:hypothetical protein